MMFYSYYQSPLGKITLLSNGQALTGLYFENQKNHPALSDTKELDDSVLDYTKLWLDSYFQSNNVRFKALLEPQGSEFSKKVWNLLLEIPYGETISYGEIAKHYAREYNRLTSPRAVGRAVGNNPVSIIIPCHRVIGSNGKLTGYAGGINRKIKLLELEM